MRIVQYCGRSNVARGLIAKQTTRRCLPVVYVNKFIRKNSKQGKQDVGDDSRYPLLVIAVPVMKIGYCFCEANHDFTVKTRK